MKYWRMRTEKEENIHYSGIDEENNMKLCPYLFKGKSYANSWDSCVSKSSREQGVGTALIDITQGKL